MEKSEKDLCFVKSQKFQMFYVFHQTPNFGSKLFSRRIYFMYENDYISGKIDFSMIKNEYVQEKNHISGRKRKMQVCS